MEQRQLDVQLRTGLQARPAAQFVQEANRFQSEVYLEKEGKKVNAKSIMGIMSLALGAGSQVTLSAEGNDEKEAIEALAAFISREN
ncbi:HPr family phosphocarrier protein [Bacillus carboniphilus]|uniref:HPr family phosphocarrier protein n=1 Tax=Bacillus carboniphilus TaxID=86663 RepID=A0ABN0VV93_9BACI